MLNDFFRFSKNFGSGVFFVHPTVVLVLLSAGFFLVKTPYLEAFYVEETTPHM